MTKLKIIPAIVILLMCYGQQLVSQVEGKIPYKELLKYYQFPKESDFKRYAKLGENYKEALELIKDRQFWARCLQIVQERTGLVEKVPTKKFSVTILLSQRDQTGKKALACASSVTKRSHYIKVYMQQLTEHIRTGNIRRKMQSTVVHELTHIFQQAGAAWRSRRQPNWIVEGMAKYVDGSGGFTKSFYENYIQKKKKLPDLDKRMKDSDSYNRGELFFKYIQRTYGTGKVKEFFDLLINKGLTYRKAAEKITGKKWKQIKKEEYEWATNRVR
jgi:hypothetical protein